MFHGQILGQNISVAISVGRSFLILTILATKPCIFQPCTETEPSLLGNFS